MFQDVELSAECQSAFRTRQSEMMDTSSSLDKNGGDLGDGGGNGLVPSSSQSAEPEIHIQVLTTGYWPQTPSMEGLLLPAELRRLMERFTTFYTNKYQGRRLTWAHSLERCVVSAPFPKGRKDLEVSLLQALVLRLFNSESRDENVTLSLATIKAGTGIEDAELRRTLQSLACGVLGTRVLVKEPRGREVADGDLFSVNLDFSNKLFRIKINTIQMRETVSEVEQTNEEVFRDREYQVCFGLLPCSCFDLWIRP